MISLNNPDEIKNVIIKLSYDGYKIKMYYDEGINEFVQVIIKLYIPEGWIGGKE